MAASHGHVTVSVERVTDTVVIRAGGGIDLATGPRLREALELAAADPTVRLVVCDLSAVTFLACSGLTALLAAKSTLGEHDGEIRVLATEPIVLRLFAATGLTETFLTTTGHALRTGTPAPSS